MEASTPTHLYVKFTPTNAVEMDAITTAKIPTYPYEIATDNIDASHPSETELFTFLPISKRIPACPYQIIDTVCLLDVSAPLALAAYKTAGNENLITEEMQQASLTAKAGNIAFKTQLPQVDAWDTPTTTSQIQSTNTTNRLAANTDPAAPVSTPATVTYNNCSMNTDVNYPSGRITVEETQWGNGSNKAYEGVADVKVEILGPNGQRVVAQTNRYGCFKATGAIRGFRPIFGPRLPVIMNVIFESSRKEIRGINKIIVDQYTKPLLHIFGNIAYSMNNANIAYNKNTNKDDNSTKYFVASTVNNALYDYDEYTTEDGIAKPKQGILILVQGFSDGTSTPMFHDLGSSAFQNGQMGQYLFNIIQFTGGLASPLAKETPDIIYGYNIPADHFFTDQLKETAYHEFAHASHYSITSKQLWINNINYVTNHNGYGSAGDNGVELTDLIEMWGYFMGREYAHRRYGPNAHSALLNYFNSSDAIPSTIINSWYAVNENRGLSTRNIFEWNHIPAGLLHDLIDDNTYNAIMNPPLDESSIVVDNIKGYSIQNIFNNMDGSTTAPTSLINKLRNNIPAGNTITGFDSLANSYNY